MTVRHGLVLVLAFLASVAPRAAGAACDAEGTDAGAIVDARAEVDDDCPCATFTRRADYARCAKTSVLDSVASNALPIACRSTVQRCTRRSVCGRPGSVVCCAVRRGRMHGTIERDETRCTRKGGSTVAGISTCDCPAPTTTSVTVTSTTSTTTTTCAAFGWLCCKNIPAPPGGCAAESYLNAADFDDATAECTGLGGEAVAGRCPDPLCAPPVGCCITDGSACPTRSFAKAGWFGSDAGGDESACFFNFGGVYQLGRCPE